MVYGFGIGRNEPVGGDGVEGHSNAQTPHGGYASSRAGMAGSTLNGLSGLGRASRAGASNLRTSLPSMNASATGFGRFDYGRPNVPQTQFFGFPSPLRTRFSAGFGMGAYGGGFARPSFARGMFSMLGGGLGALGGSMLFPGGGVLGGVLGGILGARFGSAMGGGYGHGFGTRPSFGAFGSPGSFGSFGYGMPHTQYMYMPHPQPGAMPMPPWQAQAQPGAHQWWQSGPAPAAHTHGAPPTSAPPTSAPPPSAGRPSTTASSGPRPTATPNASAGNGPQASGGARPSSGARPSGSAGANAGPRPQSTGSASANTGPRPSSTNGTGANAGPRPQSTGGTGGSSGQKPQSTGSTGNATSGESAQQKPPEWHDVLGVNPNTASLAEVKKTYFKKSLEMHPDKVGQRLRLQGADSETIKRSVDKATVKFQELSNAFSEAKDAIEKRDKR